MKLSAVVAAALLAVTPAIASATVVDFTFSGADDDDTYITATGSGTMTFDGVGPITLGDLDGFAFSQTTVLADPSLQGSGTFSYGLGDLLGFAAVYNGGGFSSLTLKTRIVADPTDFLAPESFQIRSLRVNGATTAFDDGGRDTATTGTVRFAAAAAVPEPASWALMIVGFGATGMVVRRRRAGARLSPA